MDLSHYTRWTATSRYFQNPRNRKLILLIFNRKRFVSSSKKNLAKTYTWNKREIYVGTEISQVCAGFNVESIESRVRRSVGSRLAALVASDTRRHATARRGKPGSFSRFQTMTQSLPPARNPARQLHTSDGYSATAAAASGRYMQQTQLHVLYTLPPLFTESKFSVQYCADRRQQWPIQERHGAVPFVHSWRDHRNFRTIFLLSTLRYLASFYCKNRIKHCLMIFFYSICRPPTNMMSASSSDMRPSILLTSLSGADSKFWKKSV